MNKLSDPPRMKTRCLLAASSLFAALFCGAVAAQTTAAPVPRANPPPLEAASAPAPGRNEVGKELSALITADKEATLSAQMAGKIKKINYAIGQVFAAGASLVEFDCEESQAKLDALNAEYLGARETHLAKLRLQGLGAAGDLEVTLAAAAGEKARSQVKQQETQLAFCQIKAPYAGSVVRLKAKQAESVAPNQPIMEIVANAQLKATINVPSAQAIDLKPGSPMTIEIRETGRKYTAKVSRMNARIDGVSQSLEIEAVFTGKTAGLLPGMIGHALIPPHPGAASH